MKDQVTVKGNLRRWFIQIPNLYDDWGLDPFEFRILIHYVRVGDCWESLRVTANRCHMSKSEVERKRESLAVKGFIKFGKPTKYGTVHIIVVDKWEENFAKYSRGVPHRDTVSLSEDGGVPVRVPKNNQLRSNHRGRTGAPSNGRHGSRRLDEPLQPRFQGQFAEMVRKAKRDDHQA